MRLYEIYSSKENRTYIVLSKSAKEARRKVLKMAKERLAQHCGIQVNEISYVFDNPYDKLLVENCVPTLNDIQYVSSAESCLVLDDSY